MRLAKVGSIVLKNRKFRHLNEVPIAKDYYSKSDQYFFHLTWKDPVELVMTSTESKGVV